MSVLDDQDIRIDGDSIMTQQFWVSDRSGLMQTAGFRSTNWDVAYLQGTLWRPKQIPEVVRSIAMTVNGCDSNGITNQNRYLRKADLNANLQTVLQLFARENSQVVIEQDVLWPDGMGGYEVQTWTGYCQVSNTILPLRPDDFDDYITMAVDLTFADPAWYGDPVSSEVSGSATVANDGVVDATNMILTFTGGSDYRLTNNSTDPATWVEVDRSGSIVVDVRQGTAVKDDTTNVIGYLSHDGSKTFFRLIPGDNDLVLTGGGTVTIDFSPPMAS